MKLLQHGVSRFTGLMTRTRFPKWVLNRGIRVFSKTYGIDLSEAEQPIDSFETMDLFFTRALRPEARPIATDAVAVSPADGLVVEAGPITDGMLIQAKRRWYRVTDLIGDTDIDFSGGTFATIYLSPRDCHRIFSPADGQIQSLIYIPGCLYPVRTKQLNTVPHLYCKNERLISLMDTDSGPMAVVAVGALNVGSISAEFDPEFDGRYRSQKMIKRYMQPYPVGVGEWIKTFHLGSTVVVLHRDRVIAPSLGPIQYGQPLFTR